MQVDRGRVKRVKDVIKELENYPVSHKISVIASSQEGWALMPIKYMGRSSEADDADGMVLLRCELPEKLRGISESDFSWVDPESYQSVEWVLNFLREAPETFGVCVHLDSRKGWSWPVIQKIALFQPVEKMVIVACGIPPEFMPYKGERQEAG